jgi:hypothetical protein
LAPSISPLAIRATMMAAPITSAGRFSPQRFSAPKGGLPPKPSGNLEWLEDLEIYT